MEKVETSLRKEPKQRRSQILVDAVAEAATRILPKVGVSGATTNRIAEMAGVSIGSLYQYFPSKESILARAIERDLQKREHAFRSVLERSKDETLANVIEALTREAVDTFFDDAAMLRLLFAEAPALDRLDAIVEHREGVVDILYAAITARHEVSDSEQARNDLLFAVDAVMGAIQAALMRDKLPVREEMAGRLRDLVLGFINTRGLAELD